MKLAKQAKLLCESGKETTLWATKVGEPDWAEDLITSTTDKQKLEKAIAWAKSNGFDRLRLSGFDMKIPPNFLKGLK